MATPLKKKKKKETKGEILSSAAHRFKMSSMNIKVRRAGRTGEFSKFSRGPKNSFTSTCAELLF